MGWLRQRVEREIKRNKLHCFISNLSGFLTRNKQKKKHILFCQTVSLVGCTPLVINLQDMLVRKSVMVGANILVYHKAKKVTDIFHYKMI